MYVNNSSRAYISRVLTPCLLSMPARHLLLGYASGHPPTGLSEDTAPIRNRNLRGTDRIKGAACLSFALLHVPHEEIESSPSEKNLVHSRVVDLARAVVKLHPNAVQRVSPQLDADGADLVRRALRRPTFPLNYAVHQAAGKSVRFEDVDMFDTKTVEVQGWIRKPACGLTTSP